MIIHYFTSNIRNSLKLNNKMISAMQDTIAKMITMKKKEDFRTLFIISLAWFSLYLNWNFIITIENKSK